MDKPTKPIGALLLGIIITAFAYVEIEAQQIPDPDFEPTIEKPAYAEGKGPVILIDEAH
jgi:hypothetical protein